ncbi:hypothetical protein JOAD_42 [Erwinia phage vB_EamM_Joad]|uniref:Uncharacterized protein n=1 Tax=Erwinia phage vB_EamM_Joad TaxID=2026081 RepID=A0A223LJ23_9CAUD|nr:hypothetical protein JOAD_42 [Erwinia phage vB_EamM_Joad]
MPIETGYNELYAFYYTEEFKTLVRSEKELLLKSAGTKSIINRYSVQMYRFDFYRLLRSEGIPPHLYWATAFINGIEDPFMDISGLKEIRTLNESELESVIARKNTVRS